MKSQQRESAEGICSVCGRFAGASDDCPYCDSELPYSPLRPLCRKWGLLAVLTGLALLWLWSTAQPVKRITAADITPRMNYALIRISGEVASRPYVRVEGEEGYVSFLLSDSTGSVRVAIDGRAAAEFASDQAACCKGASLELTGILSIKKGREVMLYVRQREGEPGWARAI